MGSSWAIFTAILTAAALLISIANTVWMWLSKPSAEAKATQDRHQAKLVDHDRRIQTVEGELKHVPTRDDVHKLTVEVTRLSSELAGVGHNLGAVDRSVERIERHLMGEKA